MIRRWLARLRHRSNVVERVEEYTRDDAALRCARNREMPADRRIAAVPHRYDIVQHPERNG